MGIRVSHCLCLVSRSGLGCPSLLLPPAGAKTRRDAHICRDLIQQPLRASEVLDRLPRLRCKALVCPRLWRAHVGQVPHYQDPQHNQVHRLAHIYDSTPAPVLGLPEPARCQCRSEPLVSIDRSIPGPDSRLRHTLLKQRAYTSPYLVVRQSGRVESHRRDEPPKLRQRVWIVNVDHRAGVLRRWPYRARLVVGLGRCARNSSIARGWGRLTVIPLALRTRSDPKHALDSQHRRRR